MNKKIQKLILGLMLAFSANDLTASYSTMNHAIYSVAGVVGGSFSLASVPTLEAIKKIQKGEEMNKTDRACLTACIAGIVLSFGAGLTFLAKSIYAMK